MTISIEHHFGMQHSESVTFRKERQKFCCHSSVQGLFQHISFIGFDICNMTYNWTQYSTKWCQFFLHIINKMVLSTVFLFSINIEYDRKIFKSLTLQHGLLCYINMKVDELHQFYTNFYFNFKFSQNIFACKWKNETSDAHLN